MSSPERHLQHLLQRAPALECCAAEIQATFEALRDCFAAGGKLLLCGNGGSAADADHWSGELLKGFCSRRRLPIAEREALRPELAESLQSGLPAIPLSSFPALTTAFGNDVDPLLAYAQLVCALGRPGDVLVGISTSGNAQNVCAAVETARARGLTTISLSGETGGLLAPLCDIAIRAPGRETYLIQEYHLPIYHCLCLMLEEHFFPG